MSEICRIPLEERWARCRELLLLADPDPRMVERYLFACEMLALCEGETVLSEVCIEQTAQGDWELRNVATVPALEGKGYASALIREVQQLAQTAGRSIWVGTSPDGVGFYQRLGFVPCGVRRGFFLQYQEPVIENGQVLEDMLMLRWSKEENRMDFMNTPEQFAHIPKDILRDRRMTLAAKGLYSVICTFGADSPVSITAVAELLGLQQPSITPSLRSLEERGYVRRRNSDQDRREVFFSVTDKTRTMAAEERRRTAQMFAGLADYLGEEDTRKLMEIMERVSSYLDQQIEASPKGNCSGRERRSQQGGNREE